MSSGTSSLSMRGLWHPKQLPNVILSLYHRAPASFMTFTSLLVSYLANLAYLDYSLYRAIAEGGLGKPSVRSWLIHTFILRPLCMNNRASTDPNYLPPNDAEWDRRVKKSEGRHRLEDLPSRRGNRPTTFGVIPHRQIEDGEKEGSERQKEIINHMQQLSSRFPSSLTLALSSYEATTSPCLFVTHFESKSEAGPTQMSRLFLSGNPAPQRTLEGVELKERDGEKHELAHIHVTEGSMHLVLSPQDARKVIEKGWGELHRLAGLHYRGHFFPPYWLPFWFFNIFGGQPKWRWGYLQNIGEGVKGQSVPPTYCLLYAPKDDTQLEWVKAIIDCSVAWAIGQSPL